MCIIETLDRFMEWARQLTSWDYWDSQYLFRGVTNKCYELEMSISRRLPPTDRNINNLRNITEELIDDAREQGHDEKNGRKLHDLELLAELQHIGAATRPRQVPFCPLSPRVSTTRYSCSPEGRLG